MKKLLDTIKLRSLKIQENNKNIFLSKTSNKVLDFYNIMTFLEDGEYEKNFLENNELTFYFEKITNHLNHEWKTKADFLFKEKITDEKFSTEAKILSEVEKENKTRERIYNLLYKLKIESQKMLKDSGEDQLFIATKIFEFSIDDKSIRAPLVFIPIKMKIFQKEKKVTFNLSFDPKHNVALLSMLSNKKNVFVNDFIFEENIGKNPSKILSSISKMYSSFDVNISKKIGKWNNISSTKKFINVSKNDYIQIKEEQVTNNILFGMFSQTETYVFNDLKKILENEKWINPLLDMSKNIDRTFSPENYLNDFNEKDVTLFSNLDLYQQGATKLALEKTPVLIQGPPGTGKTQTILNIVLNALNKDKKVLIVSEKQTALDVIYKRLNSYVDLRSFALNLSLKNENNEFFEQIQILDKILGSGEVRKPKVKLDYSNQYKSIKKINSIKDKKMGSFTYEKLMTFLLTYSNNELSTHLNSYKKYLNEIDSLFDFEWITTLSKLKKWEKNLKFDLNLEAITKFINLNSEQKENVINNYVKNNEWNFDFSKTKLKKIDISNVLDVVSQSIDDYHKMNVNNFEFGKYDKEKSDFMLAIFESNFTISNKNDLKDFFEMVEIIPKFKDELKEFVKDTIELNNVLNKIPDIKLGVIENNVKNLFIDRKEKLIEFYKTKQEEINKLIKDSYKSELKLSKHWVEKNWELLSKIYNIHIGTIENVSEFIPLTERYDYLIFDEASQIFFEKAIPSLFRASNVIVLGDQKQLRPPSFFSSRNELIDDDEEINDDVKDILESESILDFYNENTKHKIMLRGHYRSKFNDLIRFSNNEFYDKKLWFENSAEIFKEPIECIDVKGTWENNTNEVEADEVVKQVLKFVNDDSLFMKKSIGVVTFNTKQKELIEEKIFNLGNERINSLFDWKNDEGEDLSIFVKNIEDIQGEERDYIIFSVAYSSDVRNYGTVSLPGGENRINVAITRAKEKIIVIKSHKASEYYGMLSKSKGAQTFVKYLVYVENRVQKNKERNFDSKTNNHVVENSVENVFLNDVSNFLTGKIGINYTIGEYLGEKTNINIDLVIYKNNSPVMAVICEDEKFDTDFSMMEKYIFKQEFLNSRGWKVYRLNKYAWISNKEVFLNEIKKMLEE